MDKENCCCRTKVRTEKEHKDLMNRLSRIEGQIRGIRRMVEEDAYCIDIINQQKVTATNDPTDLLNRIDKQHGIHTIEHAEKIGLGIRKYTLISIDK